MINLSHGLKVPDLNPARERSLTVAVSPGDRNTLPFPRKMEYEQWFAGHGPTIKTHEYLDVGSLAIGQDPSLD